MIKVLNRLALLVLTFTVLAATTAQAQTWAGINYSQEELAIWRQRMAGATDVNYSVDGADGTPGDWGRIKQYADDYLANPTANLWQGSTTQGANYPTYEGVKLQQAAFCYLLFKNSNPTLANQYAAAVRTGLLQQITITAANISLWNMSTTAENGVNESRWITRLVVATDYMKDYLSTADKTLLNTWFTAQANFMAAQVHGNGPSQCFPQRLNNNYTVVSLDAKPNGETYGKYLSGEYPDGYLYTHRNADGTLGNRISHLATHWNNRNADKMNMVGMVGYLTSNANLIFQAKLYAKEWIKYSVYPDGTMGEYERNNDYSIPQQGMAYGAVNMWQVIMLADAGARKGDMEMYNYSTTVGLHGTEVPTGGTAKSLRTTVDKYCHNIQANPAIYYLSVTPNNRLDSYGEVANIELMWDALFSIPNKYWQSNYITSIYTRTAPNMRPYPTSGTNVSSAASVWYPWGGTGAEFPGVLFQNGQMEKLVNPYATTVTVAVPDGLRVPYVLQRCSRFIWNSAMGAITYNLRYKPTTSSTWVTLSALPYTWVDTKALSPAIVYEWQVQAVGYSISSAWSASSYLATPASCSGSSKIVREQWNNQTGYYVWQTASLPYSKGISPTSTSNLTSLEKSTTGGTNYVTRTRGFVCAPQTGTYYFWASGDDETELWLSTDDDPSNAVKLVYTKWTNFREYTKYSTQKSAAVSLIGNQRYYIEVRQAQVTGGDHFSIKWQLPDGTSEAPIPGTRITPFVDNVLPVVSLATNKASYIDQDSIVLTSTATDADGTIIRVEFYQDSVLIGSSTRAPYKYVYASVPVGTYNFKAVAVDNTGETTTTAVKTVNVTASSAYTCTASGNITRETFNGLTGDISTVNWNATPYWKGYHISMEPPTNINDNYAQRLRGYVCPPISGVYTFMVSADDQAELWLSTDELPAHAVKIASVASATAFRTFTTFSTQKFSVNLTANRRYYIEARHKDATGTDHLTVAWTLPSGVTETPIPGSRLANMVTAGLREGEQETDLAGQENEVKLSLYPNPAKETIFISANTFAGTSWEVALTTQIGSEIKRFYPDFSAEQRQTEIRLNDLNLAPGVYILRVLDGNGQMHNLRFVKQN